MAVDVVFALVSTRDGVRSIKLAHSIARYISPKPEAEHTAVRLNYWTIIESEARTLLQVSPEGTEVWYSPDSILDLEDLDDEAARGEAVKVDDEFFRRMAAKALAD
ncbi:hypothetical protein ACFVAJ_17135 [Agromyces sp. NPDC057679]|uniref:hypothetical protein n=1 Tax=Agromyces sp. NPDC057679 TaxID=3346207 RepID=UPI00366F73D7